MMKLLFFVLTVLIIANLFVASVMIYYGTRDSDKSAKAGSAFVGILSVLNAFVLGGGFAWLS